MSEKIQIINYTRDNNFMDRYHQIGDDYKLPFRTFKYGATREKNISKHGANECIEYYNVGNGWNHISGLIKVTGMSNIYYGDIEKDTIGLWIQPDKEIICITIFRGHRPKIRKAREKKVINYINSRKG